MGTIVCQYPVQILLVRQLYPELPSQYSSEGGLTITMSATSEEKLVTMAENYYLDLRGSFDESIDKVAGSVAQTAPDNNINGCFCSSSSEHSVASTTIILELVFGLLL